MGIRAWYRELTVEWPLEDPDVRQTEPRTQASRLVRTSAGDVEVRARGFVEVTRFDGDGWLVEQAWTLQHGSEALARAIAAVGVPDDEAAAIAGELAPLEPPPPAPSPPWRRRIATLRLLLGMAARWTLGIYALERLIQRRRR